MTTLSKLSSDLLVKKVQADLRQAIANNMENPIALDHGALTKKLNAYLEDLGINTVTHDSTAWTPNRLVLKPGKNNIEIFYVNTDTGNRASAFTVRGLRRAKQFYKNMRKQLNTLLFIDTFFKPAAPVEYITLNVHLKQGVTNGV